MSAETIALFLQQEIGPVQSIMYCDENGLLSTGEATVYFSNPGDATKTLLLARHGVSENIVLSDIYQQVNVA